MKFMLLCYDDEQAWKKAGDAAMREAMDEAVALCHQLDTNGQYILAAPLEPTSTATSVRIRNGKREVLDGPFAETKEFLGGFYLIEAKNREEAIEIAAKHPGARFGTVEVRPVMEIEGLP